MTLQLLLWFLLVDAVGWLAVNLIAMPSQWQSLGFVLMLVLAREPIVAFILAVVFLLASFASPRAPRIDPYVWYVGGIAAGYFLNIVVLTLLAGLQFGDPRILVYLHRDFPTFLVVAGPYVLAFLVTSILYWRSRLRVRPRPSG